MNLDINTLLLVTIYVEAILGLLLLFVWVQNTSITAVAWWGFAHLLQSASITLFGLYGSVTDLVSIDLANVLLFTAFAFIWAGARVFDDRKPQPALLFGGAVLWLVASRIAVVNNSFEARVLLSSGIIAAYTWGAAYEFWRGRSERLVSRWPAIFMLFAHGALYLLRTPIGAMLPWLPAGDQLFASVWLTALSLEALLFTVSIAFLLLAMAKERAEHRCKTAVLIDPLTGVANRYAFLQDGEAHLRRQAADPRPTAVMLIDLDNMKSINDRFGHAIGDRVLEVFADVSGRRLRHADLLGRLGGGEFGVLLSDTNRERAIAVAEQIRAGFAEATRDVDGKPVAATVSIGIVVSHDAVLDLSTLLAQADHALYRAKGSGHNRVEIASFELILDRAKRGADVAPVGGGTEQAAKSAA